MNYTVDGRNPFRTTWKPWETLRFVGIYRGIIIPGILRWCEMDFVHPQYGTPIPKAPKGGCLMSWLRSAQAAQDVPVAANAAAARRFRRGFGGGGRSALGSLG